MQKSGVVLVVGILLVSIISINFVSAGWFDDIWNKITGKATGNETDNGTEDNVTDGEEEEETCPEIPISELCPDGETLCPQKTDENECIFWDCDSCEITQECGDSDGGKDYYVRGTLSLSCAPGGCPVALCGEIPAPGEPASTCLPPSDWCGDESVLNEGYCENGDILFEEYTCSDGCENGVCIRGEEPPEPDGNGGGGQAPPDEPPYEVETCAARISISFNKNIYYVGEEFEVVMETFDVQGNHLPHYSFYVQIYDYENGAWKEIGQDRTDGKGYKAHQDKIREGEGLRIGRNKFKISTKVSGCDFVEGMTIIEVKRKEVPEPVPCGMGSCVPEEEEEVEAVPGDKIFYKCNGCELEGKCYPMGYRKAGEYCSEDYEFIKQLDEGVCENSFKCKSNMCVSGECVGEGLMRKIMKWFKKMFGGDEEGIEKRCSKLLLEHSIGEYKYAKSMYGEVHGEDEYIKEQTQAPLFSEDGEHLGTIKCCAAMYKDKEDTEHGVLFCPYDSEEDVTNSVKWLIAKERNIVFKEYEDEKVFGDDKGQIVAWINNAYLIAVGVGPLDKRYIPLPDDIANAYLKKYPSEFELTEEDIPDAPPGRPWVYCTEEDEKKGNKCESQAGAQLQTDPHPDNKSCEVYVGCILADEKCESRTDIKEREDCYVGVAEITGDSSVCEKITSDESRRNKCYVKAAETAKDASICEKITEDDVKEMCLELAEIFPWATCKSEKDMLKEECHFFDDFESGLGKWVFSSEGAGSEVVENGNTVLRLVGVERANVHRVWDNYLFKFRFKMIDGSVHVDFRRSEGHAFGAKRYFVAMNYREIYYLSKQVSDTWRELEDLSLVIDNNWHTLEIKCYGDIINVYVDNELVAKHKDTMNPLLSGWVRFEAHTGGVPGMVPELLIDDVEIKLITEEDIIYP